MRLTQATLLKLQNAIIEQKKIKIQRKKEYTNGL